MNEERRYKINERRICKNKEKILLSQNKRFKYRLIECSIFLAALFSSSCSYLAYKTAPVDGAIKYTIGENTTEKKEENNYTQNQPLEIVDGRFITSEGINKSYEIPVTREEKGVKKNERVEVPLYTIAGNTKLNNIICTEQLEVESDTYIYVKTIPTHKETVKDMTVGGVALFSGIFGCTFLERLIGIHTTYEERLKSENRKKTIENRRIIRSRSK